MTAITVAAALELPAFRRGLPEVVAAADRLDREIRWVHAAEVPNIAALLKGGELLLTTGMGIGDRTAEQRRFVLRLAARGVAALVVELGTRYGTLPAALVETAEAQGLPLVQLHREVPFVAISEAVLTEIVNDHHATLRAGERALRRCTDAAQDDGAAGVLAVLAEHLGRPVRLEDRRGGLVHLAVPPGHPADGWDARGPAGVAVPIPDTSLRLTAPSAARPFDRIAAEHAAGLLAILLRQARQEEELTARTRGDFLADLAAGRIDDPARRARPLGFQHVAGPLVPVVVRLPAEPFGNGWERARHAFDGLPALLGIRPARGWICALVAVRSRRERAALADRIADRLTDAGPVTVVGDALPWEAVGGELAYALLAAEAAEALPPRRWHDARRLEVDVLLWRLDGGPELAAFVDRALGPLLEHDRVRPQPLLPTLAAYLGHGAHRTGRKTEAARALRVNRQTLYDRLSRIAALLDADLDDPECQLRLRLALRALDRIPPADRPDRPAAGVRRRRP
ncbi:PucR family transcriptional regulator [Actinomadura kijaniata]|uniref:PucR family transcriptional regulator n=1 Tax=Actinomadura kijaniata TaxID=46161 RepID=UPI001C3F2F3E|nr:PucR family transcriptional regulator ligand-binding domain-containing protein [Actinomadura kijaniata]